MQTPTLRMNGTVIDPADAVRSARDLQVPDARDLLRGLDAVPGRVDTALGAAGDSLREAGDQLRGTIHELSAPRRERRLQMAWPWLVGFAAIATLIGLGTWWFRRSTASPAFEDDADIASLDREDLERASGEGMGTAPGATDWLASPSNGFEVDLVGVGPATDH
jgi:hypothetical protein